MFYKKFRKSVLKIFATWSLFFIALPIQIFQALPVNAAEISAPTAGSLVINEIMKNPDAVADTHGEWFELYNPTDTDMNITGLTVLSGSRSFTVTSGIILAKGFFVLGRWAQKEKPNGNGGVDIDYAYGAAITMLNNDDPDNITLKYDNIVIDTVIYDDDTFPDIIGESMILSGPGADNSVGSNWCSSTSVFGDGDKGTPGKINDPCPGSPPPEKKITVCHFPSGSQSAAKTVEINESSWSEHESHGDIQGACPE